MVSRKRVKSKPSLTARILKPGGNGFTNNEATAILKMRLSTREIERMQTLIRKNRESVLSDRELEELDGFITVARFVDIAHLKD